MLAIAAAAAGFVVSVFFAPLRQGSVLTKKKIILKEISWTIDCILTHFLVVRIFYDFWTIKSTKTYIHDFRNFYRPKIVKNTEN